MRNTLLVALLAFVACGRAEPPAAWSIASPYEGVDWARTGRHRACFHSHTTETDGKLRPHEVVDAYHRIGTTVLAITDHNARTDPWTAFAERRSAYESRDPAALGMIAVPGNELSHHDHTVALWSDDGGDRTGLSRILAPLAVEASLRAIAEDGGLAILAHPGRYRRGVEWHASLFRKHPVLVGMEIYNQGDRYPEDRDRWDAILTALGPDRPVWGHSADDMHVTAHVGRNWNLLLLPELSEEWVRRALESGRFLWVYAPGGPSGPSPPTIEAIRVDADTGTIEIDATGHHRIDWISNGSIVAHGPRLQLAAVRRLGHYVRAVLHGAEGSQTGTQPFGLSRREE